MKYVLLVGLMVMMVVKSWGQVKVDTVIEANGDTLLSTKDTLSVLQMSKKKLVPEVRIEGHARKSRDLSYYRLYIDFHGTGAYTLSNKNSANFKMIDGSVLSLHYDGDDEIYSGSDIAAFYIDITDFLENFKKNIAELELETSNGKYTITLEGRFQEKIPKIVKALTGT